MTKYCRFVKVTFLRPRIQRMTRFESWEHRRYVACSNNFRKLPHAFVFVTYGKTSPRLPWWNNASYRVTPNTFITLLPTGPFLSSTNDFANIFRWHFSASSVWSAHETLSEVSSIRFHKYFHNHVKNSTCYCIPVKRCNWAYLPILIPKFTNYWRNTTRINLNTAC